MGAHISTHKFKTDLSSIAIIIVGNAGKIFIGVSKKILKVTVYSGTSTTLGSSPKAH